MDQLSVDELALDSFGKKIQQIKERMQKFTCTNSVVVKALATDGLKGELNAFRESVESILVNYVMCNWAGPRPSEIIK